MPRPSSASAGNCCCCCGGSGACTDQVFNFAQMIGDVTSQFHVTSEDGNVTVTDGQAAVTGSPFFNGKPAVYLTFDTTTALWILEMSGPADADGAFFGWSDFTVWGVFVEYAQNDAFYVKDGEGAIVASFGLADKFAPWHVAMSFNPTTGLLTPLLDLVGSPASMTLPADPTAARAFWGSGAVAAP